MRWVSYSCVDITKYQACTAERRNWLLRLTFSEADYYYTEDISEQTVHRIVARTGKRGQIACNDTSLSPQLALSALVCGVIILWICHKMIARTVERDLDYLQRHIPVSCSSSYAFLLLSILWIYHGVNLFIMSEPSWSVSGNNLQRYTQKHVDNPVGAS